MTDNGGTISLTEASKELSMSRERTLRWLLCGRLDGLKTEFGWRVTSQSIEAVKNDRAKAA
jgi:hypothetical protein